MAGCCKWDTSSKEVTESASMMREQGIAEHGGRVAGKSEVLM